MAKGTTILDFIGRYRRSVINQRSYFDCGHAAVLLAISAGLVDGLNQRAIRTASLGRESTYVFHKSDTNGATRLVLGLGSMVCHPACLYRQRLFCEFKRVARLFGKRPPVDLKIFIRDVMKKTV